MKTELKGAQRRIRETEIKRKKKKYGREGRVCSNRSETSGWATCQSLENNHSDKGRPPPKTATRDQHIRYE